MPKLGLEEAKKIIGVGRAKAKTAGMKPLAIVVLDAGGHLIAAEKEDGAANKLFDVAFGKANAAISTGTGTRGLMPLARESAHFLLAAGAAMNTPLLAMPGGVLIMTISGDRLGAVGVSGDSADNDELIATEGITSIGFLAQVD